MNASPYRAPAVIEEDAPPAPEDDPFTTTQRIFAGVYAVGTIAALATWHPLGFVAAGALGLLPCQYAGVWLKRKLSGRT